MRERPIARVPKMALLVLAAGLALQIVAFGLRPVVAPRAEALPIAPSALALRVASLGEPVGLAKLLILYLQGFDDQAGVTEVIYNRLDYPHVISWLDAILDLDPRSQYPLTLAANLYAEVKDEPRQRLMLDWVARRFHEDPNQRWPSMARAAITAKHSLHDLPLALKYAHAIRTEATGPNVPFIHKQMEAFILEDMNELDSAQALLGGLIENGQITDPKEVAWMLKKIERIKARSAPK